MNTSCYTSLVMPYPLQSVNMNTESYTVNYDPITPKLIAYAIHVTAWSAQPHPQSLLH